MTHTVHDEEVDEFNAGFDAYRAGVPVENEPETEHDLWRAGYAFSAFDDLRAEVARLRAEVARLRAGRIAAAEAFDLFDKWVRDGCEYHPLLLSELQGAFSAARQLE